MMFCSISQWLS